MVKNIDRQNNEQRAILESFFFEIFDKVASRIILFSSDIHESVKVSVEKTF